MIKPKQLENIDWTEVIRQANELLDTAGNEEDQDCDNSHYMYEAVMQAVFGDDVFKYINEQDL